MQGDFIVKIYSNNILREINLDNFNKNEITVGRDPFSDILLDSKLISRKHATFRKIGAYWHIFDNNSTNGLIFEENKINNKILNEKDRIIIGVNNKVEDIVEMFFFKDNYKNLDENLSIVYLKDLDILKIGRDENNNIVIFDKFVSRNSVEIRKNEKNRYCINALKDINKVYLNGHAVENEFLKPDDKIDIKGYQMIYIENGILGVVIDENIKIRNLNLGTEDTSGKFPFFQRSPRIYLSLPKGEVSIPPPPQKPAKPEILWMSVLMMPGIMLFSSFMMAIMMKSRNSLIFSLPMALGSIFLAKYNYKSQNKKYFDTINNIDQKYTEMLQIKENELMGLWDKQYEVMHKLNLGVFECYKEVREFSRRLWERTPVDKDFLYVRLGIGDEQLNINIKFQPKEFTLEEDELENKVKDMILKFSKVKNVPICISLKKNPLVGFIGYRFSMLQAIRNIIIQIATHHSPDEVKLVGIFPKEEFSDWEWMKWLPHVWDDEKQIRFLACEKNEVHNLFSELAELLHKRKSSKSSDKNSFDVPHFLFIIGDVELTKNESLISFLIKEGFELGVSSIFMADGMNFLPKDCNSIVEFKYDNARIINPNLNNTLEFAPDKVNLEQAEKFSQNMAPIRLRKTTGSKELPNVITILNLFNANTVRKLNIEERWKNSKSYKTLSTAIGAKYGEELMYLDLHEKAHGPHGLVAGTTGSGKSEILQSFIISLAINYHPHYVGFVLIDYKGGGMANLFENLPHLQGTITNLEGSQIKRALFAIKGEIKRRQRIFARNSVNNINDYQKRYQSGEIKDEPLSHLIIIVDEFAELKMEQPDFMKELVSAARVGRSLGFHLILATQKPSGVVDDQIWSNTRFRLCLRVERPEDSREVIKHTDAANLTRPGRAYIQIGNDEIFEIFQGAWSGGGYKPKLENEENDDGIISIVDLSGKRRKIYPIKKEEENVSNTTELQAITDYLNQYVNIKNISKLPSFWLPLLKENIPLEELRNIDKDGGWNNNTWDKPNEWINPVIGFLDDPLNQNQEVMKVNIGKEGHLIVYGAPATGKTTFLQTMITSLALTYSPEDVNIYIMDFGGRTLNIFSEMPHVGGVIMQDDIERFKKFIRMILKELDYRKKEFSKLGISNLKAYREETKKKLPAIIIVLDNYSGFVSIHQDGADIISQLCREGGNLGIHLVITTNTSSSISYKITGNVTLSIALQVADRSEYSSIVGRTGGLEPSNVAGRGLINRKPPLEFQTAVPIEGENEAIRTRKLKELMVLMSKSTKIRAKRIPEMPVKLCLDNIIQINENWIEDKIDGIVTNVGISTKEIEEFSINLLDVNSILNIGIPKSGKTTFVKTFLISIMQKYSPKVFNTYIIDSKDRNLSMLSKLGHVKGYATEKEEVEKLFDDINKRIMEIKDGVEKAKLNLKDDEIFDKKEYISKIPEVAIVIDDFDYFFKLECDNAKEMLQNIIQNEIDLGIHVIINSNTKDLSSNYDNLAKTLKTINTGMIIGTTDDDSTRLFNVRLPYDKTNKVLPKGEGIYINNGQGLGIKVANCDEGKITCISLIKNLLERKEK